MQFRKGYALFQKCLFCCFQDEKLDNDNGVISQAVAVGN